MRPLPEAPRPIPEPSERRPAVFVLVAAALYLAVILYLDHSRNTFARITEHAGPLAACSALVLVSFVLRYQRWRVALAAQGFPALGWLAGLRAYLAGFAFTVSPGKAGELLRIRYFGQMAVPSRNVLASFVFERAQDLAILTVLSLAAAALVPAFGVLAAAVVGLLAMLYAASTWPSLQNALLVLTGRLPGAWLRQLGRFVLEGLTQASVLLRPGVLGSSLALGSFAWLLTAVAFAYLCHAMGLSLTWHHALGIYPLAMLAGAASFVPGGVGTTEAAIVLMLASVGAPLDVSLSIAVGIRLATLWLAIAVGTLAMLSFEGKKSRGPLR